MTIEERARTDKRFKKMSQAAKFIKYHINRKLGMIFTDIVQSLWDRTYNV